VFLLLLLKQKGTKLQIWCISHWKRLHFLERASVYRSSIKLMSIGPIWFVLTVLLT